MLKAQDSLHKNFYIRDKIRFNPLQAIVDELSVSYEHRFSEKIGIEVMGGSIYSTKPITNDLDRNNGCVFRFGIKYYMPTNSNSEEAYLEPILMYKYVHYSPQWVAVSYIWLDAPDGYVQSQELNVAEIAVNVGKEIHLFNIITMDCYWGIGLRYRYGEEILYEFDPANDYKQIYPSPIHVPVRELFPTIKLGIKIGLCANKKYY